MSDSFPDYGPGGWTFENREIAEKFDNHVREQLPWYDLATGVVTHLVRHYLPDGGAVIDAGASTGNIGRAVAEVVNARGARFLPVDAAESMAEVYAGPGDIEIADLRSYDFAGKSPDVIVAFLVLMFLPVPDRAAVIEAMKSALRPGGCLIVFDKMEQGAGYSASAIYRLTLAAKYEAGASPDEVIRKELSLAGIQRPMSAPELTGFEPVFRFGDFAGWVYERPAVA